MTLSYVQMKLFTLFQFDKYFTISYALVQMRNFIYEIHFFAVAREFSISKPFNMLQLSKAPLRFKIKIWFIFLSHLFEYISAKIYLFRKNRSNLQRITKYCEHAFHIYFFRRKSDLLDLLCFAYVHESINIKCSFREDSYLSYKVFYALNLMIYGKFVAVLSFKFHKNILLFVSFLNKKN